MKTQVVVIHGGDTFDTYEEYLGFLKSFKINDLSYFLRKGWRQSLQKKLGEEFQVIAPQMPNKINAKYLEWKIWFEKLLPFLEDGVILVGHSIGGIFLAKYLSENDFPNMIRATFLIAAPFDGTTDEYGLADFILPQQLDKFQSQGGKIFLYQSRDDAQVPFESVQKYQERLPEAKSVLFENRGHFSAEELPELVEAIKNLA